MVPKDLKENLEFRKRVIQWGSLSEENAQTVWIACKRSLLFYINVFGWGYDPRDLEKPCEPFITWDFQDDVLRAMEAKLGKEDMVVEKSRDMGGSWMFLWVFEWQWHFYADRSFLLVSAKEDLVDNKENPDALMWKIDFMHRMQPRWLMPTGYDESCRTNLHFFNPETRSTIDGVSSTSDSGRGGRKTAVGMDEFAKVENGFEMLASTRDVTDCRIFVFTPNGTNNAAYVTRQKIAATNPSALFTLHWTKHPRKSIGKYIGQGGKPRSPWYDEQCKRASSTQEIAQELDIDYLGSSYPFFDITVIDSVRDRDSRSPFYEGELTYDSKAMPQEFEHLKGGRCKLWMQLDHRGMPPLDDLYVVSADTSMGTGASNTVICAASVKRREKVLEFASPHIQPHEAGSYAVAIARWLGGAFLIWETNGPGRAFGKQVEKDDYRNVYMKTNERSYGKKQKDEPGWDPTTGNKDDLLFTYRKTLLVGDFIDRSFECYEECKLFIVNAESHPEHSSEKNSIDPSGAKGNHGDRVIATALLVLALSRFKIVEKKTEELPASSFAARREHYLASLAKKTTRY